MNFTQEHQAILELHREHWDTLQTAGYMRNIDRPVFDKLQRVFNEAIAPTKFTHWCGACVAEMVRLLYMNFDSQQPKPEPDVPEKKPQKKGGRGRAVLDKEPSQAQSDAEA